MRHELFPSDPSPNGPRMTHDGWARLGHAVFLAYMFERGWKSLHLQAAGLRWDGEWLEAERRDASERIELRDLLISEGVWRDVVPPGLIGAPYHRYLQNLLDSPKPGREEALASLTVRDLPLGDPRLAKVDAMARAGIVPRHDLSQAIVVLGPCAIVRELRLAVLGYFEGATAEDVLGPVLGVAAEAEGEAARVGGKPGIKTGGELGRERWAREELARLARDVPSRRLSRDEVEGVLTRPEPGGPGFGSKAARRIWDNADLPDWWRQKGGRPESAKLDPEFYAARLLNPEADVVLDDTSHEGDGLQEQGGAETLPDVGRSAPPRPKAAR